MNVYAMVVLIVLITTIGNVLSKRYQALSKQKLGTAKGIDVQRDAHEMQQLKDRIAVLERVITDNHGSLGLDREIERLRDR
ncbi:MAG TPA: hypothetical protein VF695_01945 [Sphingomonas sp.]|jgi:cell division protein FtsB